MRSIIKVIMAVAIYVSSVIAHQQPLDSRLAALNLDYDTVMSESYKHSYTGEPHPKALLGQIKALEEQTSDLIAELGCLKGDSSLVCRSLLVKDFVVKKRLLIAESEWAKIEKEQRTISGTEAEKEL